MDDIAIAFGAFELNMYKHSNDKNNLLSKVIRTHYQRMTSNHLFDNVRSHELHSPRRQQRINISNHSSR
ncbi:hypothetical protein FUT69_06750 [Xylella taiwanensis]|uniref:Uncharacterized protein n=2 Tax=Xylella taiwanensis TaxID=1444770 RepID=Z9JIT0_9GAMM|nr:hypothetical protein [Xylella taiwanensis]AXI84275.1 hypothetical protein AB672_10185 [Xylella taiwanensis]EWS77741.1 hypothetical protein AF72_09315 [Xylella taiwanensis]MCD8457550.1 hypothetical protein [Xylella taiwanensis]MCD8462641.1 hypothetical protein [Xylella taiwanensis]MCD8466427.1 hypothetical protein [Xylella taiwanensis]